MSVRVLLVSLFFLTILTVAGFILFLLNVAWTGLGPQLPVTIAIGSAIVSTYAVLQLFATLVLLFITLLFGVLLLLLERLVIDPVQTIARAIDAFAEHGTQIKLPKSTQLTLESRELADAFLKFTDNVEKVHERDMEISRVKSDFISTAAHQIRTPLTGIRWALEALEKEQLTEGQQALVKSAVDKSHDLVAIVGTLLDISSIESGKYKYKFEMVDMDKLVAQIVKDFIPLAQKNSVTLFYERSATLPPAIRADQDRVKWLLNNLVENAIRYTPAQGTVKVSTQVLANKLLIKVRDNGIGIPEEDRNNIFERFFRAGNAIAKENQGNGLGLYIARQIAVDHGGDLYFEANEGSTGTTFTLALPIPS